ncbi:MAG: FecR domain-containing protein [Candidatus Sungbacteria bacterium]|nr:FecR domain-containing protein [Candidatus Sungbacteria bacterium]
MMKIAVIAAVLAAVAFGAFFALRSPASPADVSSGLEVNEPRETINLPSKSWIEVIRPKVLKVAADERDNQELKSGDEIEPGTTIQVDRKGLAALHMPDGSILRIDSESKTTVEDTTFNSENESLKVKIRLLNGRVWSKILALVTPESEWEVRTSNAVATVRGTAFGFAFVGGRSRILGSENTTTVNAIDPSSGEILKEAQTTLGQDKFVEIRASDIINYKKSPRLLAARDAPAELLNQEWVKRYKREDQEYNQKLGNLRRETGLENRELRKLFRENTYKEFEDSINRSEPEAENGAPLRADETLRSEQKTEGPGRPSAGASGAPRAAVVSLEVEAGRSLEKVTEGDEISLRATAVLADGSRRDVTREVLWQVVGPVGSISSDGRFSAKLGDEVSELGRAPGTVVATFEDKITGESLLSKTPLFNVDAKIEATGQREG